MTNEEREDLNTFRHDLIKRARWWQWKAETLEKENEQLKAENAALRERLEKAVEIPDYVFECINGKVERIFTEYLTVGELKNLEANGYSLTKDAAEARLAELKGEKE